MRTKTTSVRAVVAVAVVLLLGTGAAWAHHALVAQFDIDKSITVRGTVTKTEWINPHARIHINVKRDDGRFEDWTIETGSPNRMENRGLKRADFQPGTEIIVGGFSARDGTKSLAGWIVTFPDREASGSDVEASFPLGR